MTAGDKFHRAIIGIHIIQRDPGAHDRAINRPIGLIGVPACLGPGARFLDKHLVEHQRGEGRADQFGHHAPDAGMQAKFLKPTRFGAHVAVGEIADALGDLQLDRLAQHLDPVIIQRPTDQNDPVARVIFLQVVNGFGQLLGHGAASLPPAHPIAPSRTTIFARPSLHPGAQTCAICARKISGATP